MERPIRGHNLLDAISDAHQRCLDSKQGELMISVHKICWNMMSLSIASLEEAIIEVSVGEVCECRKTKVKSHDKVDGSSSASAPLGVSMPATSAGSSSSSAPTGGSSSSATHEGDAGDAAFIDKVRLLSEGRLGRKRLVFGRLRCPKDSPGNPKGPIFACFAQ